MVEVATAAVWQGERLIPFANTGQLSRQGGETVSDEMDDLAFALDTTLDAKLARRKDHAPRITRRCFSSSFGQMTRLARPIPLARPSAWPCAACGGRWSGAFRLQ